MNYSHNTHRDRLIFEIYLFIYTQISHKKNTRNTRRRTVFLSFIHIQNLWKHSDYERTLKEFKIEENLYIELAAYPK